MHILMEFLTFQPNMLYISESLEFNGRKISSKTQKAPALHRSNIKGSRRLSETPCKNAQIKLLNAKKINHTSSFTFILFKFRSLKLYKKHIYVSLVELKYPFTFSHLTVMVQYPLTYVT